MTDREVDSIPLDWARIEKNLGEMAATFRSCAVYESISSTNDWALQQCAVAENLPAVCLAEMQQQGRGRRGREWVSPASANIYMSVAWSFPLPVAQLGPLSLAAGVAIVRSLRLHGVVAQLKWPNDVMVAGKKIAGVLIESRIRNTHATEAVIGIGLNFAMREEDGKRISQAWTDFKCEYHGESVVDRNRLIADVLVNLVSVCDEFIEQGFTSLRHEWCRYDMCKGGQVEIICDGRKYVGDALGIDDMGALKVRIEGRVQVFYAADISLRMQR